MLPGPLNVVFVVIGLVITWGVASRHYGVASIFPALLFGLGFLAMSPTLLLIGFGLLVLIGIAAAVNLRGAWFAAGMITILAVANVASAKRGNERVDQLVRLREKYPLDSLKTRLAFHDLHPVEGGAAAAAYYASRATEDRGWGRREWQLRRLHDENYARFVASPGFGFSRMPRVYPGGLETPTIELVKATSTDICFDMRDRVDRPKPSFNELDKLHRADLAQFLDQDRMGFVESIDRVAGFERHAVATAPKPIPAGSETWQVARMELVSLLKHDTPVAYVSEHLPNLDELDGVPTRPLDEFESAALTTLRDGQDLATADEPTMIRMLGAVRAESSCLACHAVPEKTLLGAFSYELRPVLGHEEEMKQLFKTE